MERFSQRESVLLGYNNLHRPLMMMNHSSSSSSSTTIKPFRNSDVDFHDVFGGPPRRFSMQEVRRAGFGGEDDGPSWPNLDEKPVFGDDILSSRRRLPSADFFNDIFGGDSSVNSTPIRIGREGHHLLSSPGARVLSPLPPKAEPVGSSSLLSKFSLPAKLSKGLDFPTFGGSSRSSHKQKDSTSLNGITHSYSSGNSLSRFSSEASKGGETPKIDPRSANQLSSLFKETPINTDEESPKLSTKSDKKDIIANGANLKKDSESSESSANSSSHFHFSIYTWASKGVPLDLPRRGKTSTSSARSKETSKQADPAFSGSNDRAINKENIVSKSSKAPLLESFANGHTLHNVFSSKIEHNDKLENGLLHGEVKAERAKPHSANKDEPAKEDPPKAEVKAIHSLFFDHGRDEVVKMDSEKKTMDKSRKGSSSPLISYTKTAKKQEQKNNSRTASEVDKVSVKSSPKHAKESNGRSKGRGRVKEFVKMFNQDSTPKPKEGVMFRSRSCKWNEKILLGDEMFVDTTKEVEKLQMPKAYLDPKQSAKVYAARQDSLSPNDDSFSDGSKTTVEETDGFFSDHFQVKELTQVEDEKLGSVTDNSEFKEIDLKIRKWTKGKEGNIRSLLSTLQYVLWAESGWKAVPLVDIIEGNAVKRAYQKALLCLHPDKLQQKGADSQQKYMAEKVFDTLQDAWNYFNSLGAV